MAQPGAAAIGPIAFREKQSQNRNDQGNNLRRSKRFIGEQTEAGFHAERTGQHDAQAAVVIGRQADVVDPRPRARFPAAGDADLELSREVFAPGQRFDGRAEGADQRVHVPRARTTTVARANRDVSHGVAARGGAGQAERGDRALHRRQIPAPYPMQLDVLPRRRMKGIVRRESGGPLGQSSPLRKAQTARRRLHALHEQFIPSRRPLRIHAQQPCPRRVFRQALAGKSRGFKIAHGIDLPS